MGYNTYFNGEFEITGQITDEQVEYINKFCDTRRVKRDVEKLKTMHSSPEQLATSLRPEFPDDIGVDGAYYVGNSDILRSEDVIDYNQPPEGQPGLWCQWIIEFDINSNHYVLRWDQGEKFYNYIEWLEYMIEHFFIPWNLTLNGDVEWEGIKNGDLGLITVKDNVVTVRDGEIIYKDNEPVDEFEVQTPCPHCGNELEVVDSVVFTNVDMYGGFKTIATKCCNKAVSVSRKHVYNISPVSGDYGKDDWGNTWGTPSFDDESLYMFEIQTGKYAGRRVQGRFLNKKTVATSYGNYTFDKETIHYKGYEVLEWMDR